VSSLDLKAQAHWLVHRGTAQKHLLGIRRVAKHPDGVPLVAKHPDGVGLAVKHPAGINQVTQKQLPGVLLEERLLVGVNWEAQKHPVGATLVQKHLRTVDQVALDLLIVGPPWSSKNKRGGVDLKPSTNRRMPIFLIKEEMNVVKRLASIEVLDL
jgi:hypothetical protein